MYAILTILSITFASQTVFAQILWCDPVGDHSPRRTDNGADGPIDPASHRFPDIRSVRIGPWAPLEPQSDLYEGAWDPSGLFFRLDLEFSDVINPPGPLGCCGDPSFDPFRYGPHPLLGYVEIDIDNDVNTGGELDLPHQRYLGNVARYGGYPSQSALKNRVALDGGAFDGNVETLPLVDRSGEDFHIVFAGWEIEQAGIQRSDETDWVFGEGETWIVPGHLFQRAHGYRQFSSACCRAGAPVGSYEPPVSLRFSHDASRNRTAVSLVYPLTNEGAAAARGEPMPEPLDPLFTNHNSIKEALTELVISAIAATPADRSEPEFALIEAWEFKDPDDYLDPMAWRLTVLVGGSYTVLQEESPFVWSDTWPSPRRADFDGNMAVDTQDLQLFNDYLLAADGVPGIDADGIVNGQILLLNLGPNFSMYDVNQDGKVDNADRLLIVPVPPVADPDFDWDDDADQSDFGYIQACLTGVDAGFEGVGCDCMNADMDGDDDVDDEDILLFESCASGPAIPVDPDCRALPGN